MGRADNVSEFIRIGKNEAEVEVELFNAQDISGNYEINRIWWKDPSKTRWSLNGKVTTGKEIQGLVKNLNIQTDNLCQFLPQDKVHDFSKMNSKQLLGRTVDAIGEPQLKDDHERLKNMQSDVAAGEDRYRMKMQALNDNRKKCDSLEKDVKNLEEKENIERNIIFLQKKKEWNVCEEAKQNTREAQERRKNVELKIKVEEKKIIPIQKEIKNCEKEMEDLHKSIKEDQQEFRASMGTAKNKADRIERIREEMDKLDDQMNDILAEEDGKKRKIQELGAEIKRLTKEVNAEDSRDNTEEGSTSAEEMAANLNVLKADLKSMQNESIRLANTVSELKMEMKALESKMGTLKSARERLMNVDNQKLEILREKLPQGKDAYDAAQWLGKNMDKFQTKVYTPVFLHINVKNTPTAMYLGKLHGIFSSMKLWQDFTSVIIKLCRMTYFSHIFSFIVQKIQFHREI